MNRLFPQSLLGQVLASVALALLVAQLFSASLLYRAGEDRRELSLLTAGTFQIINGAERAARDSAASPQDRTRRGQGRRGGRAPGGQNEGEAARLDGRTIAGLPRPLRYIQSVEAPVSAANLASEDDREAAFRDILLNEGLEPHAVAVTIRAASRDPAITRFAEERPRFNRRGDWKDRQVMTVAIQRAQGGNWEAARILEPQMQQARFSVIVFQTLVLFAFLMVILFLVLRRITRPLAQLTDRVASFSREPDKAVMLEETGPSDTRHLIAAHNAMEAHIVALLDEKDVMLGAIGHDLKTPLAALRVRIESVPDDTQRERMARSIEDITTTLDDILALARVGRDGSGVEAVDLGALAIGIVEEFEDLNEPVAIDDPPRVVARVQVTWIRRALRNLVSNAVRYGEAANVSLRQKDGMAILRVEDHGEGIPEDRIAAMMEPFTRGEVSRNRATGGAGLGLTLARAIIEQHHGELVLTNRKEGGLRAEIRLPL